MSGGWPRFFERYPRTIRPASPPRPLGNAGGLSGARLYRFEVGNLALVARRWPSDGPGRPHLEQVHRWLQRLASLGFIPVPLPTLDGPTLLAWDGHLWEITPWMPGNPGESRPPTPGHSRIWFEGLATVHARLASEGIRGISPGLAQRVLELEQWQAGDFRLLQERLDQAPTDPAMPLTRLWVDQARLQSPGLLPSLRPVAAVELPLQPCLRDARPDHFLIEGDRLAGLVDFGAMGVDSVVGDLARLLGEGVGNDPSSRCQALEAYEAIRPLSTDEVRALDAFERANAVLGAGRWARWHFLERRRFDPPTVVLDGLRKGLERLVEQR